MTGDDTYGRDGKSEGRNKLGKQRDGRQRGEGNMVDCRRRGAQEPRDRALNAVDSYEFAVFFFKQKTAYDIGTGAGVQTCALRSLLF